MRFNTPDKAHEKLSGTQAPTFNGSEELCVKMREVPGMKGTGRRMWVVFLKINSLITKTFCLLFSLIKMKIPIKNLF